MKRNKKGQFIKGNIPWHKGMKNVYSQETLKNMSLSRIGKEPWNKTETDIVCSVCGIVFHRKPSHVKKNNLCSIICRKKWHKKYCNQLDIRKKMSERNLGRKYSKERNLKLSILNSGKNHPQWKGGITPENRRIKSSFKYKKWRELVFERDNYTCQMCELRGVFLHPHHIRSFANYSELRFEVSNGITLCKECHMKLYKLLRYIIKEVKNVRVECT